MNSNSNSNSKSNKKIKIDPPFEFEYDDRLSALPDPIIVDILSLLPFTAAVTTGILSRRWFHFWNQLTTFRVDTDTDTVPFGCYKKFFSVMDDVLHQLSSPEIEIFEFQAPPPPFDCSDQFKSLVEHIIDRRVKEFKVNFTNHDFFDRILLPDFVLESRSLKVLELGFGFDYKLPENGVNLPNLRKLDVSIYDDNIDFLGKLVKCCPVLEDLQIEGELVDYENSIEIFSLNLKLLRIGIVSYSPLTKVLIDAPKLEYFNVSGPNLLKFCFAKVPSKLFDVEVCTTFDGGVSSKGSLEWELVRSIANVRTLVLQGNISPAFYYMNKYPLPVFQGLASLELSLHFPTFWKGLMRFLEFCPNLQIIRLQRIDFAWYGAGWVELDIVPVCLLTKVKSIMLKDLVGVKHELKLLGYILLVAKVLETLQITIAEPKSEEHKSLLLRKESEFCQQLYRFPKSSISCQIKVVSPVSSY
ncbi:F-box/FBD/LRR-repeat protein At1g16930-like [Chenopodium quinoa]|uniref:F-box/FBD/LRR-repeat protein At1g16930-like n=1 Tax=Chenopodium quinoa TaxID=63459 RepID=UPI000B76D36B|nr:F-box/FBD/LRR-repeat protein At1g16930-like [Chenopodium quinoa]